VGACHKRKKSPAATTRSGAKGALAGPVHARRAQGHNACTVDVRCARGKGLPDVTYAMLAGYDRCLARHLSCPHPHPPVGRPRLGNVALYTGGRHHVAAGCTCGCESPPDPDPATLYTHGPPPGLKSCRAFPFNHRALYEQNQATRAPPAHAAHQEEDVGA
jgi:hypothetical protein